MKHPDLNKLIPIFKRYPDIRAAYLFGSQARQQTHQESDLDIALIPANDKLRMRKLDILTDLAHQGFDHVDLVILDSDDIVLKFEAIRHNQVIYASPDHDPPTYFSQTIRQYFDFLPYLEIQREAYKRRILND